MSIGIETKEAPNKSQKEPLVRFQLSYRGYRSQFFIHYDQRDKRQANGNYDPRNNKKGQPDRH